MDFDALGFDALDFDALDFDALDFDALEEGAPDRSRFGETDINHKASGESHDQFFGILNESDRYAFHPDAFEA